MSTLSEGALDQIMNGVEVDKPVLQILGNKKLSSSSSGERYRLLISDGVRINSFAMLATQLNYMITDNVLTEFTVCQINRYAISMVNNGGKQKRVMVILNIDVKIPGTEVGAKIGNPTQQEARQTEAPAPPLQSSSVKSSVVPRQTNQRNKLNESISSGLDVSTTPIAALSPYQNRWIIKARVTNKSAVRTWSNSRGEGKLFNMDLVDESGEIRCTAFREQCDKFYDMIEIGKVYYFSRCGLKPANKTFNNLSNDYEMSLNNDSEIIACHDDTSDIPSLSFNFVPISDLERREKDEIIDVLGVCKSHEDVQKLTSRTTRRELTKRDVHLVDESNTMICLTLWGSQAEEFDGSRNPVLAIKGARIGEFNGGKNLSTLSSTTLQVDPDIPEAHKLRGWFDTTGRGEDCRSISVRFGGGGGGGIGTSGPLMVLKEAQDMRLGEGDVADSYVCKASITLIRPDNALYKSCPTEDCKKKVIDGSDGMYRCEKCNKDYPNFKYRLLMRLNLADWSGNQWATAFSEEAEKIIGLSAQELGEMKETDEDAFGETLTKACFKSYVFKMRVKSEVYNDEARLKAIISAVSQLDYVAYNNHLIAKIKGLANISDS